MAMQVLEYLLCTVCVIIHAVKKTLNEISVKGHLMCAALAV